MDEEQMLSRALISYVRFNHPQTIMHPILTFSLDLLWEKLAKRFFLMDRVLTMFNCVIFVLAECLLNQPDWIAVTKLACFKFPSYLFRSSDLLSFCLMCDLLAMATVEPMFHCLGHSEAVIEFRCDKWTDTMSLLYEIFVIIGVFLYVILMVEVGSISVRISEYRVLCLHAIEQVLLCFGVVLLTILTFSFAVSGMTREVQAISNTEALQFCGVYTSLAEDIKGHARLARGEIIIETFKAVRLTRWQRFMNSLNLDSKVDFEEGDIGLAGGIKDFEPALAHPVAKEVVQRTIQKSLQKYLGKGKAGAGSALGTVSSDDQSSSHHSSDNKCLVLNMRTVSRLVLQTVVAGGAEDETMSVVDEALSDAMDSDFGAGVDPEGKQQVGDGAAGFGETMNQLALSSTEATVLRKSFDMVLAALGNDREAMGDAIYGLKIHALVAIKEYGMEPAAPALCRQENFTTPRAVVSLRFFNCFRLLLEKAEDPNELKIYVETLAFKHLNNEITEQRVEAVQDAFNELMVQNVPNLPPGTAAAWRKLLSYTGSCYRYVGDTYGERLRVIKEDWAAVQKSATDDRNKDETKTNAGDNANAGGGDNQRGHGTED
eukprot:g9013.t1